MAGRRQGCLLASSILLCTSWCRISLLLKQQATFITDQQNDQVALILWRKFRISLTV